MGYEKSKVYKLQHDDGHFYIGSTINELRVRYKQHKNYAKSFPNRKVYSHINNEWDNVKIILIEEFVCDNREQIRRKENEYLKKEIDNPLCLNLLLACFDEENRTEYVKNYNKEYRKNNAEYFKAYSEKNRDVANEKSKIYYEKNRERIAERNRLHYHAKKLEKENSS